MVISFLGVRTDRHDFGILIWKHVGTQKISTKSSKLNKIKIRIAICLPGGRGCINIGANFYAGVAEKRNRKLPIARILDYRSAFYSKKLFLIEVIEFINA